MLVAGLLLLAYLLLSSKGTRRYAMATFKHGQDILQYRRPNDVPVSVNPNRRLSKTITEPAVLPQRHSDDTILPLELRVILQESLSVKLERYIRPSVTSVTLAANEELFKVYFLTRSLLLNY
jgi:hypothetical protein